MLGKLVRSTTLHQVRRVGTKTSTEYIPGKQGYAPEFAPPKPIKRAPKSKPSFAVQPNAAKPKPAPEKLNYKQQVTELRKVYIKELQEIENQRKLDQENKLKAQQAKELAEQKAIQEKALLLQQERAKDDLSILNIEGQTISTVNPFLDPELKKARKDRKLENYRNQTQHHTQQTLESLLGLVTQPNQFITEANIEQIIEDCFNSSYMDKFGISYPKEVLAHKNEVRLAQLERVLTGELDGYPTLEHIQELNSKKEDGVESWINDMKKEDKDQ